MSDLRLVDADRGAKGEVGEWDGIVCAGVCSDESGGHGAGDSGVVFREIWEGGEVEDGAVCVLMVILIGMVVGIGLFEVESSSEVSASCRHSPLV